MKIKAVIAKSPQRIVVRVPGRMQEPVQAPKSVQTSEPAQEPVRADLIAAAKIIASCPKSRLDTVISLLERSGIDMTVAPVHKIVRRDPETELAYKVVMDAVKENRQHFTDTSNADVWGAVRGDTVLIANHILADILNRSGYDFERFKINAVNDGFLQRSSDGRMSVHTSCFGNKARYVIFKIVD